MLSLMAQVMSGGLAYATLWPGTMLAVVYGAIGIGLLLLGYWLFDLITPRIDVQKELTEKNIAVAIVVGALLLGIAYVVAHVVGG